MDVLVLLLVGWILTGVVTGLVLKKENIVRLVVVAMIVYFSLYIIVSGVLFWIDIFSVSRTMIICIICMLCMILMGCAKKHSIEIEWNIRDYILPLVIILCALPIVLTKYEFFGTGQDEGVYQTQAIQFVYDYNHVQRDYDEYNYLSTDEAKEDYKNMLQQELIGVHNYDPTLPFASEEKEVSEVSSVFHGIPTFPALLAIFGKILGIRHMSDIQTIFYICSIFLMYFTLTDLNVKKMNRAVGTTIYAFSPIVLWTSKSALTEIGLTFLIIAFIYFVLKMERKYIYLSILPLIAFCFYHLTIYTMFPVFVLIYLGLYLYSQDKNYLICTIIFNSGFLLGITMMLTVAGTYSFVYNLTPFYRIPGINQENVFGVILFLNICVYAICGVFYILQKHREKIVAWCVKLKPIMIRLCLIFGVLYQWLLILKYREQYHGGFNAIKHLSLTGFILNLGVIIPIFAGLIILFFTKKICDGIEKSILLVLFLYCVIFYSCFMRAEVQYYYYYGRYIAPYISIGVLFSALALEKMKNALILILGIASLGVLVPYERTLYLELDDTRVTWNALDQIVQTLKSEKDKIVLIRDIDMKFYYLPLSAMTDVICLPYTSNIKENICSMNIDYYYLTQEITMIEDFELYFVTEYQLSEDNNFEDGKILPFPLGVMKETRQIMLWKATGVK